ncbi:deoxyguanosinetriphosphate triphosphohydrolase family protein [Pleomorphochaeta sp. DL1XJH-081]|uniref:deoxyguanosinetriphosphate triphosphohydrolase family protein n=1 Tax=Pleomorphochaeta sp. DL1XJH-081 TaxID=3409690 RepID=UPI003BB78E60
MRTKRIFENGLSRTLLEQRLHPRVSDVRGEFYRDTTAIIHSSPFRRLKHKTQVFFAPSNDHICTRMEHVLHVASIASAVCRGLGLDTELAWAIGMGHDLGHTPFGHVGERILSDLMEERGFEGFEHELNSLRIVDFLAEHGKGLNLTYAVRDGIASHNGERFERIVKPEFIHGNLSRLRTRVGVVPSTWEAAVVRFSDQIAYLGRDYEDACRLSIIEADEIPDIVVERLGKTNASIINTLVNDLIDTSTPDTGICFSEPIFEAVLIMKEFNYRHIYLSPMLEGYSKYFSRLLRLIVDYLQGLLDSYGFDETLYMQEKNMLAAGFGLHLKEMREPYMDHDGNIDRILFDYVAGMSDNFCLDCANEILKPDHLNEHIERSVTGKWFDVK